MSGFFQPIQDGYDVKAVTPTPVEGKGGAPMRNANGCLTYKGMEQPLWVFNVEIGFAISGTTGQSFRTRSFFPRNFTQPQFIVQCQAPQKIYASTVEFIRSSQTDLGSSMRLEILPGVKALPNINGARNRQMRGTHSAMAAEGYVKRVLRNHERHIYVPDFSFEFVVERMLAPKEWADDPVKMRKLLSWNDVIKHSKATFVDDPDPTEYTLPDRSGTITDDGSGGRRPT